MIKVFADKYLDMFNALADAAFSNLSLSGDAAVSVAFVDEDEIRGVNNQFRGIDKETDVLSFPSLSEIKEFNKENYPFEFDSDCNAVMLGDIVICVGVMELQAAEYGHSVTREAGYLFTHGLLHLLGYDHMTDTDKSIMRKKEEEILEKINLTR